MEELRVDSIHDIKNINSINGRYTLKTCETYMYIQDEVRNSVVVEISFNTDLFIVNNILSVFGFPKIVIEKVEHDKDAEILKLRKLIQDRNEVIKRQRNHIEELQSKAIQTSILNREKVIKAYQGLIR